MVPWAILVILAFCPFRLQAETAPNVNPEALQMFSEAVEGYEQGDYGRAKLLLPKVLELDPNLGEAYILKGLLLYRDGKYEEAGRAFEEATRQDPKVPDRIRERLEVHAHEIEETLTRQEFSRFELQFHGAVQRERAWEAVKHLNEAYNQIGSQFSFFLKRKIPVVIFSAPEFVEAWQAPFWLGGFFDKRDGKIRVRIDPPPGGDAELRLRLRHEFVHAFLYQMVSEEIPAWFHEGAAQFYAYAGTSGFWKEERLETLRKMLKGQPRLGMQDLQDFIDKKKAHPVYVALAYLEAEGLVLYVAKQRGESWIPKLVSEMRRGSAFQDAFARAVSADPARMLDQLHRYLD